MKKLSIQFCKNIGLEQFNKDKWFQWSYSTMQRTKKGGTSTEQKERIKIFLYERITNINKNSISNQSDFNKWLLNCIKGICKKGNLTFGQGQKIINILLKYYYCFYYSEQDKEWNKDQKYLKKYFSFFNAPVDNIILAKLKKKYNDPIISFLELKSSRARFNINGNLFPWSKLEDSKEYLSIQDYVENLASKDNNINDKLCFEMKYLWKE